jgi:acyl-coenzyme A thioesterase PaaI-like protein
MTGMTFLPQDPDVDRRVRASFACQQMMATLGIEISRLSPSATELTMLYAAAYTQQHGFVHAGIIATALDSGCGYAAFSLMPADVFDRWMSLPVACCCTR